MRIRFVVLAMGLVLAGSMAGTASAHDPDRHTHVHDLGDGVADTPKEMDLLQAAMEDPDDQHGPGTGHLPGSSRNVDLVGKVTVSGATGADKPSHIADVATLGNYAYLAARRLNTSPCGAGGFYTVDISNPSNPTEVSFTAFPPQSYPGEGMQALKLSTSSFSGDILVTNNENCGAFNPASVGGMSIYNITDPTNIVPLAIGKGDMNAGRANQIHSVFAWQAGPKAYAILVDNQEVADVDIMDITDPMNPAHIAEVHWGMWADAHTPLANGESVFLHDMVVKQINGHWYALLSYWDAGWIILNVDNPASPVFVDDSNYPDPEPLLGFSPPEGNAHQAEWSSNNRFIVGTDEDFSPTRTSFQITSGPNAGIYGAGQFSWTVPISAANPFVGSTVWGGSGCVEDLNANGVSDRAEVPSQASTGADIVVFTRGFCFFSDKVRSGEEAGYTKVIVGQSHGGTRNGLLPNGFTCGAQGSPVLGTASAICLGHRATHLLFEDPPAYAAPEGYAAGGDMPAIGTMGASVSATTTFDGWGTVQLLNAETLQTIDNYAVAEGIDPAYATGFGTLSVHEVATDPRANVNLAYLSYYDAGLRVVKFGKNGFREVGHYIATGGNDFWGVELTQSLNPQGRGAPLILMSDRDSGLWIFRYTGD